jgi:Flp pilus assembly protein TadG
MVAAAFASRGVLESALQPLQERTGDSYAMHFIITSMRLAAPRRSRHSLGSWIRWSTVSSEKGSSLVETAIVMPLLLLLMTGIFSFSMVIYQKLQLAEAVSTGARFLAIDRGDNDPCAATATKIYNAAPGLTKSKITLSFVLNGTTYSGATCSGTTNMVSGATAQVTATYPCSFTVYGANFGACSLSSSTSEAIQ